MKKFFSVLTLLLFLCAQGVSLWHMAEHGASRHLHHGKQCGFHLHAEHQNADAAPSPLAFVAPSAWARLAASAVPDEARPHLPLTSHPRAPPAFS